MSPDQRQPDARQSARRSLELAVELTTDERNTPTSTVTANVSQGGMFIVSKNPPPIGTMVKFKITVGDEIVRGMGRVTWIRIRGEGEERPPGMGVEFTIFQESDRFILLRSLFDV